MREVREWARFKEAAMREMADGRGWLFVLPGLGRGCVSKGGDWKKVGGVLEVVEPNAQCLASLEVFKEAVERLSGSFGVCGCEVDEVRAVGDDVSVKCLDYGPGLESQGKEFMDGERRRT